MKYDEIYESLTGLSYMFTGITYINFVQFRLKVYSLEREFSDLQF